ncbi:MAG: hypothetical protein WCA38_14775 [Candidatus Acidiferrales bacterium]
MLTFWLCGDFIVSCLSPLIFLSYGIVTSHGISALSDKVALFLFFGGFLIAYRFKDSAKILISAPIMALGFYYEPQYIAGPLAVLLCLFIEKRFRLLTQFVGLLAICGLGLLALFQWAIFRGQEFWRHVLLYQAPLLSWHQFKTGFLVLRNLRGSAGNNLRREESTVQPILLRDNSHNQRGHSRPLCNPRVGTRLLYR